MSGPLVLFWSHAVLAWMFVNYVVRNSNSRPFTIITVRVLGAVGLTASCSSPLRAYPIMIAFVVLIPLLAIGRGYLRPRHAAELEVGTTLLFMISAAWIVQRAGIAADRGFIALPLSEARIAALLLVVSAFVFSVQGGTYIVRGVLEKSGALPRMVKPAQENETVDVKEFNRGRLIGALERVLLVTLVALQQYAALGFVFAAKGLIRSRDFENRDLSEYFLIGSLTSVTLAVAIGLTVRLTLLLLW